MHNEFIAIIEQDGDWFIAYCPRSPSSWRIDVGILAGTAVLSR